jgi:hypothetical protein
LKEKHRRPLWAVKPILQSQGNDGFGADSGPPQGDRCGRAIRPIEASKAAIRNGRFTSTRDVASNVSNARKDRPFADGAANW